MHLSHAVLKGDRLALSRLLTDIEKDSDSGRQALNELFPHTGKAHLIGVTGAPGTGKSSLVNRLALHYRQSNENQGPKRIAIVAVDPSSPFSGGAVLGDRIRMNDLSGDKDVFIRSMASRGSLGGLATTTAGFVQALDAAGYDIVIIETVGAGQAEVEIAKLAHTTIVVEAPGFGDDIQAIKAGILEIADILVLNKADRPGVEAAERALLGMLTLGHPLERVFRHHARDLEIDNSSNENVSDNIWITPLQRTIAMDGTGIEDLVNLIAKHKEYLDSSGEMQRKNKFRLETEFEALLQREMMAAWRTSANEKSFQDTLERIALREISPRQAVEKLLNGMGKE